MNEKQKLILTLIEELPQPERREVLETLWLDYCKGCGGEPSCPCWNDD